MTTLQLPPYRTYHAGGRQKKFYTIHSSPNDVYTARPNETTSVMSFSKRNDALLVASMLENYREQNNDWPILDEFLPKTEIRDLRLLDIREWVKEELEIFCIEHVLSLITVNSVRPSQGTISLRGDSYAFDVDPNIYRNLFEKLLDPPIQ